MTDKDLKYIKLQKTCSHLKERIDCLEHAKQFKDLLDFLTKTDAKLYNLESKLIQKDTELTFAKSQLITVQAFLDRERHLNTHL